MAILDAIPPGEWDEERAFSYESALGLLAQVISRHSRLLMEAQEGPEPDQGRVDLLLRRQAEFVHRQRTLSPGDPERVASVSRECVRVLRDLQPPTGEG
ncbi:hypothetical protein [Nocardiopsis sp. MG754419]|uniref:hypothetical protein n=1 Tax=Nocardiopsis sp. MG754419 TaxID=2259865 RepID=UPI001BAC8A8F|nr:hypothetical protein [Nocardiopsis sp. MG754419]